MMTQALWRHDATERSCATRAHDSHKVAIFMNRRHNAATPLWVAFESRVLAQSLEDEVSNFAAFAFLAHSSKVPPTVCNGWANMVMPGDGVFRHDTTKALVSLLPLGHAMHLGLGTSHGEHHELIQGIFELEARHVRKPGYHTLSVSQLHVQA